jgi:hypothetical protein
MVEQVTTAHVLHDHEEMNWVLKGPVEGRNKGIVRLEHEPLLIVNVLNLHHNRLSR